MHLENVLGVQGRNQMLDDSGHGTFEEAKRPSNVAAACQVQLRTEKGGLRRAARRSGLEAAPASRAAGLRSACAARAAPSSAHSAIQLVEGGCCADALDIRFLVHGRGLRHPRNRRVPARRQLR